MSHVYMKVSGDKYELPIAVADSAQELAIMCNTTISNIYSSISHRKQRIRNGISSKKKGYAADYYIKVELEKGD